MERRTPASNSSDCSNSEPRTANYGTASFLCIGNDHANSERVLIHFDLSSLGSRASIASCLLTLTVRQVMHGASTSFRTRAAKQRGKNMGRHVSQELYTQSKGEVSIV